MISKKVDMNTLLLMAEESIQLFALAPIFRTLILG
jgi:hypothetical protein